MVEFSRVHVVMVMIVVVVVVHDVLQSIRHFLWRTVMSATKASELRGRYLLEVPCAFCQHVLIKLNINF